MLTGDTKRGFPSANSYIDDDASVGDSITVYGGRHSCLTGRSAIVKLDTEESRAGGKGRTVQHRNSRSDAKKFVMLGHARCDTPNKQQFSSVVSLNV